MDFQRFSTELEAHVLNRALPPAPHPVRLVEDDEPDVAVVDIVGYADGQSFMIEYVDSRGRPSSRRITVYSLDIGRGGVPLLTARCHERKATRQFRVDRIRCCIDYSGEVFDDVPTFLEQTFGMSVALASRRGADDAETRWRDILDLIRDDAILLAAMSQSDGAIHPAEIEAATAYLMGVAEADGAMLSPEEGQLVAAHFKRLRPTGEAIRRALEAQVSRPARRIRTLLMAAVRVLDADGQRHPAELELLNDLCRELTGVEIGQAH